LAAESALRAVPTRRSSDLKIDTVRSYVRVIFQELKENPELDSILIDKDIRNVMMFIRETRETALATQNQTKEKKAKASAKKASADRKSTRLNSSHVKISYA